MATEDWQRFLPKFKKQNVRRKKVAADEPDSQNGKAKSKSGKFGLTLNVSESLWHRRSPHCD